MFRKIIFKFKDVSNRAPRPKPEPNEWGLLPVPSFSAPWPFRLLSFVAKDIRDEFVKERDDDLHIYGIRLFVGLPGYGKTMSMVFQLDQYRRRYGDRILIATNFYYKGQDFPINSWEDITKQYDKPIIVAYDEIQNEFNSRQYAKFPMPLVHALSQVRKGNGMLLMATAQEYTSVDKTFRNNCNEIVECRTRFKRLTTMRFFTKIKYEAWKESTSLNTKMKIKPEFTVRFVQDDFIRQRYDSYARLEYLADPNKLDYQMPQKVVIAE